MYQWKRLLFLLTSVWTPICLAQASNIFFNNEHDTWSRYYIGGNLGIVKHTVDVTDNQATTFYATIKETSNPQLSGGFQLGFRLPVSCKPITAMYGLEFSANFANASYQTVFGSPYALYEISAHNQLKNIYLLEALGGIALDKSYMFLGAGFSWTNLSEQMTSLNGVPYFDSFNQTQQTFGTVLSAGLEYAVCKNLSTRFKVDVVSPNNFNVTDNLGNQFNISQLVVQGLFGVNYLF